MAQPVKRFFTPDEYLAMEEVTEFKHEYFNGEIFDMVGASRNHNLIVGNIHTALNLSLKGKPCEVYVNDMRLLVKPNGLYTYPDVIAVCGKPEFLKGRTATLTNPTLVVEVLSESTREYDSGKKFDLYKALASLKEYVLVEQDRAHIDYFQRVEGGSKWVVEMFADLADTLRLESVGCTMLLQDIYHKVEFEN